MDFTKQTSGSESGWLCEHGRKKGWGRETHSHGSTDIYNEKDVAGIKTIKRAILTPILRYRSENVPNVN